MSCGKEKCDGGCKNRALKTSHRKPKEEKHWSVRDRVLTPEEAQAEKLRQVSLPKPIEGRAKTYEQKRAVMEKILAAWASSSSERLGQFLINCTGNTGSDMEDRADAGRDLFYVEDSDLAEYASKYGQS